MARWVTAVRLASSVWLQPSTALAALTSAANCTRFMLRSLDGVSAYALTWAVSSKRKTPADDSAGASDFHVLIRRNRSRQEVLVDTRRDRQVVHILNVAARRAPSYLRRSTIPNTGQVIIGRQQGRGVRQRQLIARQRRRIQVLIEELHTEVERLGEVVLEAGA